MRILCGKYKNKQLSTNLPKSPKTTIRPTTAKVRKALFSLLRFSKHLSEDMIQGKAILDLCCGSGAFGLEALSQNASEVMFVDNSPLHISIVRRNVENLNDPEIKAKYMVQDIASLPQSYAQYNTVYIDAPYSVSHFIVEKALLALARNNFLAENHIVVVEVESKANVQHPQLPEATSHNPRPTIHLPDIYNILESRIYGNVRIIMMRRAS
jgi:16S rRNA (guanine966-N2)-methyltransferase